MAQIIKGLGHVLDKMPKQANFLKDHLGRWMVRLEPTLILILFSIVQKGLRLIKNSNFHLKFDF